MWTRFPIALTFLLLLAWVPSPTLAQGSSVLEISEDDPQTSLWVEAGYVLAMETVFTGMSYVSTQDGWGPFVTGGADLGIAVAGFQNASHKTSGVQKTGHYLVSLGFVAKSLYNVHWGRDHSSETRFWTNLVSYNVLVFTGYLIDSL